MDVVSQLLVGAAILWGVYAVVTLGLFTRAVDGFADWYIGAVAPTFGVGSTEVVQGGRYDSGFFQARPEAPIALTFESVSFAGRPGSGPLP